MIAFALLGEGGLMSVRVPADAKPIVDLAIQITIGAVVVVFIGLVALGLSEFVDWLHAMGAPYWLVTSMHYLEMGLYGLDVFCFAFFLVNEARKFVRKLDWSS